MRTSKKAKKFWADYCPNTVTRSRDYYEDLIQDLRNPAEAAAYLNAHMRTGKS